MSASPQRLHLAPQNTTPEMPLPTPIESREAELLTQIEKAIQASNKTRLYATFGLLLTFALGVLTGYFLYLLWEQVGVHDGQIAGQQNVIQRLTANETTVSNQVSRLRVLDGSVDSLKAQFDLQSRKLADLERNQNGMRDQVVGMNSRWQREFRQLSKVRSAVTPAPPPAAVANTPEKSAPASSSTPATPPPQQQSGEKHNETFSPDLKPSPNAYAQMSPSGLVVWMTPRPGFAKPVPTSVIGHVRGLGMLVHDWDDDNHYFVTESGSWILDQR